MQHQQQRENNEDDDNKYNDNKENDNDHNDEYEDNMDNWINSDETDEINEASELLDYYSFVPDANLPVGVSCSKNKRVYIASYEHKNKIEDALLLNAIYYIIKAKKML